jgi:hypothetical protein
MIWIDATRPLEPGTPVWPGDRPFERESELIEGWMVSAIATTCHVGTHLDTPRHLDPRAPGVEQVAIERLVGPAEVVRARPRDGLVTIDSVIIEQQNIVGAKLPVARTVKFKTAPYSKLAKPIWVDFLVESLQQMCTHRVHLQVRRERVARLKLQVRRITQRVNLFEKVLIPQTQENIRRIQIGLGEQERTAVVRAKIAKKKHATI